jgi:hypothetical protein
MEVLIGWLADAWAPQIAEQYLLDNVLAAEGIAKSILREEIGAACFIQRARPHPPWTHEVLPAGLRRGVRAAPRPGREVQPSSGAGTRGTGHREPGGTGHLVACMPPHHQGTTSQLIFFRGGYLVFNRAYLGTKLPGNHHGYPRGHR